MALQISICSTQWFFAKRPIMPSRAASSWLSTSIFITSNLPVEVELAVEPDRAADHLRRLAFLGQARAAAIAVGAQDEAEGGFAVGGGELARLDGDRRIVQEQVGLELRVVGRIGLEGDDAAEMAGLVRQQRVEAPVRTDIEEDRLAPVMPPLLLDQAEQLVDALAAPRSRR